jgi:hypothetical protein
MFTGATALAQTVEAAVLLAEVNLKAAEMTVAAGAVIGVRMGMIAAAPHYPCNADRAELSRMVPEKIRAFSEAGTAVVEAYWSLHRDVGDYMVCLGRTMMAGRVPLPSDLIEMAERTSIHATRIAASGVGAVSVALAPLHKEATANARRLARRNGCA